MSGMDLKKANTITLVLMDWYQKNKRVFPFRGTLDPYRVWLSEIMLQQTRTETAGPYYERFLKQFPDVFALAFASQEAVLKAWEGLGYYTRARNLHKTAGIIAEKGGVFPRTAKELQALPGIGPYAAAAIASIAFDEAVPAMDGNLNRVISRLFLMKEDVGSPSGKARLLHLGFALMPKTGAGDMNQALMDLGATICLPGTPDCVACPLRAFCEAFLTDDPATLPVMKAKPQPKPVPMAVVLAHSQGKMLLTKRKEALLNGLYVFLLHEGDDSQEGAKKALEKHQLIANSLIKVGTVRHVFTHRVWQMNIYLAQVTSSKMQKGLVMADEEMLKALPLPTAMGKAREAALQYLNSKEGAADPDPVV